MFEWRKRKKCKSGVSSWTSWIDKVSFKKSTSMNRWKLLKMKKVWLIVWKSTMIQRFTIWMWSKMSWIQCLKKSKKFFNENEQFSEAWKHNIKGKEQCFESKMERKKCEEIHDLE